MAREYLDDAFGPDGVRVSIAIEEAVDRLVRARDRGTVPSAFNPIDRFIRRKMPSLVQSIALDGAWAVEVEADSGERARVTRSTRDEAYGFATEFRQQVEKLGVPAIGALR